MAECEKTSSADDDDEVEIDTTPLTSDGMWLDTELLLELSSRSVGMECTLVWPSRPFQYGSDSRGRYS